MKRLGLLLIAVFCMAVFSGCSSIINSHRQKESMMESYLSGDNARVLSIAQDKMSVGSGDEVMWRLETGSTNFLLGNYRETIQDMDRAERLIQEFDQRALVSLRDVSSEGGMLLTNLNALPYRGFCRDRIALSIYKALAYLGTGNEGAFRAQLNRMRDAQKQVQRDYKAFFQAEQEAMQKERTANPDAAQKAEQEEKQIVGNQRNADFNQGLEQVKKVAHRGYWEFLNPAATFLSALGCIRDGNYENARIEVDRLCKAMPKNPLFQRYMRTVLEAARRPIPPELQKVEPFPFPLDRDCVYVIFANGRSAAFRQIAIYFPIMTAWPMCEYYDAPATRLLAAAGGATYGTAPLADMDAVISQEYEQRLPGMITRIVLSTAVKEAAAAAATYAASQANGAAGAAVWIGGAIYRAAMNTADTRSWEVLPKEFQLTQFPMPADHKVVLTPEGGKTGSITVQLPADARSAILYVNMPSPGVIQCNTFALKSH